jgi:hypothetical protein
VRKLKRVKQPKTVKVKVGGVAYDTVVEKDGIRRFKANAVVRHFVDSLNCTEDGKRLKLDMNGLREAYRNKQFTQREYAEFHIMLGYSVDGFCTLSPFQDMKVEVSE